uniref:Uncharacterized protein n=1 Tax=Arundo donax TaxID=35708 RepID=A0A0A9AJX5_ARUDO
MRIGVNKEREEEESDGSACVFESLDVSDVGFNLERETLDEVAYIKRV